MGFTRAQLESFSGRVIPDLLGDQVQLLFVGINPGLWSAATGTHFARAGNRFYPALHCAGILDREIRAAGGFSPADVALLTGRGIGITNLVARATARADELSTQELTAGAVRLHELVVSIRPRVVAVLGVTAYRTAFDRRRARIGRQPEDLAGAELWVVRTPAGSTRTRPSDRWRGPTGRSRRPPEFLDRIQTNDWPGLDAARSR